MWIDGSPLYLLSLVKPWNETNMSFILPEIYFTNLHLSDGSEELFHYLVQELLFLWFWYYFDRLPLYNSVLWSDFFFWYHLPLFIFLLPNLETLHQAYSQGGASGCNQPTRNLQKLISLLNQCNILPWPHVASAEL